MTLVFKNKEEIDLYYNEDFKSYQFVDEKNDPCNVDIKFNFTTTEDILAHNITAQSLVAGNIDAYTIMTSDISAKDIDTKCIVARNVVANDIKGWCTITAHSIKAADIIATEINAHGDVISYGDIITNDITAWGSIRANNINYFGICGAYGDIICNNINGRKHNSMQFSLDGRIVIGEDQIKEYISEVLELNSLEDMKPFFNSKTNCYEFVKPTTEEEILKNGNRYIGLDIHFNFDLDIKADLRAGNIKGKNIKCYNIDAYDITAQDIRSSRIYATDISCRNIRGISVEASFIKCKEVYMEEHIDVNSIDANYMLGDSIRAHDSITCREIEFMKVCYAHQNIVCESINGLESNSKYFVLEGEIKIKDGR